MSERNRFIFFRYNKSGRSTQMSEETKWFPRKETNSPRTLIYRNECPDELHIFEVCLGDNGGSLSECATQNAALETCGSAAFKMINSMTQTYNFDKGLKH